MHEQKTYYILHEFRKNVYQKEMKNNRSGNALFRTASGYPEICRNIRNVRQLVIITQDITNN
jgi:hypothetical protein